MIVIKLTDEERGVLPDLVSVSFVQMDFPRACKALERILDTPDSNCEACKHRSHYGCVLHKFEAENYFCCVDWEVKIS